MSKHPSTLERKAFRRPLLRLAAALLFVACASLGAPASGAKDSKELKSFSAAEAEAALKRPVIKDADADRVLRHSAAGYARLKSLKTVSRDGGMVTEAFLQRPNLCHYEQRISPNRLVSLAVCDGQNYSEYHGRTQQYVTRPAAIFSRLVLPVNVRAFFPLAAPDTPLMGMDSQPVVREYAFYYAGKTKVKNRPAEALRVDVMVRSGSGSWQAFESRRAFDSATGLLVQAINGDRSLIIENTPNPPIPKDKFRFVPPPGAVKSFG